MQAIWINKSKPSFKGRAISTLNTSLSGHQRQFSLSALVKIAAMFTKALLLGFQG